MHNITYGNNAGFEQQKEHIVWSSAAFNSDLESSCSDHFNSFLYKLKQIEINIYISFIILKPLL